jgi:hypothetical protein
LPDYFTERGFAVYADIPTPEGSFTVQESSLATEHQVWIGLGVTRAGLNKEQATRVRDALNEFIGATE